MIAFVRAVLAAAQGLLAVAAFCAAYDDPHDVLVAGSPQSIGAICALIAVACLASALVLSFGDFER